MVSESSVACHLLNVTRLNLGKIKTIVARYLRKQTTTTLGHAAPTDVGDNDWIVSAINLGVARIVGSHQWSWLHQTVPIVLSADGTGPMNINGDASKYRLPAWVQGVPFGAVHCDQGDGCKTPVDVKAHDYVDRLLAENNGAGVPSLASFKDSILDGAETGQGVAWVMTVCPPPSADWTITATFRVAVPEMVEDEDVGVWPQWMERLVIAAAVRELLEYGILNPTVAKRAETNYGELLVQAIALDDQIGRARQNGDEAEYVDWAKSGMDMDGVTVWP